VFKVKNDFLTIFFILIAVMIITCAPAKKDVSRYAPTGVVGPGNLNVEANSRSLDLIWDTNRGEDMLISGYNIYISPKPITFDDFPDRLRTDVKPYNQTPYPGDDNPEIATETFTASDLDNGVKYYVAVTTVFPDQSESPPSNVIEITCYPRGTVTLNDRGAGGDNGFAFKLQKYVPYNDIENDIYFIARDMGNQLGSPDRNEGVLKHTLLAELGRGKPLNDRVDYNNLSFKDRAFVAEGTTYLLKLEDGSFAKILVRSVISSEHLKRIVFDYLYLGQ
jgi:hypothetical protein